MALKSSAPKVKSDDWMSLVRWMRFQELTPIKALRILEGKQVSSRHLARASELLRNLAQSMQDCETIPGSDPLIWDCPEARAEHAELIVLADRLDGK